jgi:uncharacterized membrane protein YcaP (DUF421 family)
VDLIIRTVVVFLLIFLLTRVIGRRELGSLEPFDLILMVVIGDLVQQGVTQSDYSLTGVVLVISTLCLMTVSFSFLSFKFPKLRPVLDGEPLVLLEDGQVIEGNLRRERLTLEELAAEARLQQIGQLSDVRFAVLETNGNISFIEKQS